MSMSVDPFITSNGQAGAGLMMPDVSVTYRGPPN